MLTQNFSKNDLIQLHVSKQFSKTVILPPGFRDRLMMSVSFPLDCVAIRRSTVTTEQRYPPA